MSLFEKFVREGSEKADDLATALATMDEGFMAEARAKTMQQERKEELWAVQAHQVRLCTSAMKAQKLMRNVSANIGLVSANFCI